MYAFWIRYITYHEKVKNSVFMRVSELFTMVALCIA